MRALLSHRLAPVVAMATIVVLLPLLFPSAYYYRVAALVFVFALASIGLNLLMGFAGQVSLGHAGLLGVLRHRGRAVRARRLRRWPPDSAPQGTLPRRCHAGFRPSARHRLHQRGALHRGTGRHGGAASRSLRLLRVGSAKLVLDHSCELFGPRRAC